MPGDAKEDRQRRELLKAELQAQHDASTEDFLRNDQAIIPSPNRRFGVFVTHAKDERRRKHRATGGSSGRPRNHDVGLAQAVYSLMTARGIEQDEAIAEIARWLVRIGSHGRRKPTFKAARERVYKALNH